MKLFILYFIRVIIIVFLLLPIIYPYIKVLNKNESYTSVNILIPSDTKLNYQDKNYIENQVSLFYSNDTKIKNIFYGSSENLPIQNFEDLILKLNQSNNITVIISEANLFGDDAKKFIDIIKNNNLYKQNKLYFLPFENLPSNNKNIIDEYLVLSEIFIPQISFLGEESMAHVSVVGKGKPSSIIEAEILLHSGSAFLNSKKILLQVTKDGNIQQSINIPINFTKTGTQVVTANVASKISKPPVNTGSTSIQVVYSKSTLLHIAVGPDWSLRTMRQKLKFWPNLDLLSYYILLESQSDQSIPNSQLSLIEFPSDKLFGSSLPNFHGIIAQNFSFDTYLGEQESQNLTNYVKNGGRMVFLGGPLSFSSENNHVSALFPCTNTPTWDDKNNYNWTPDLKQMNDNNSKFTESLSKISSQFTAVGCKLKNNAIALARTDPGNHPVLIAMSAEKGIVLSFLSGDWLYHYTQKTIENTSEIAKRMQESDGIEFIFNWMVEFLQRRQDSGIRAPDISSSRIYSDDIYLSAKRRGGIQLNKNVTLENNKNKKIYGTTFTLNHLAKDIIKLNDPLQKILPIKLDHNNLKTQFELAINQENNHENIMKFGSWPIFNGKAKIEEKYNNPFLFEDVQKLNKNFSQLQKKQTPSSDKVPIINAYPWLLAAALFLLSIEQFLARILWKEYFDTL
ncbi:MAG: hypothetical protein DCC88_03385 [Spirobacillus cienkowskii]|jgi:hypothetical protein|uniref:Glutamine amidotransferase domain-containing protein n=1 Tax=Spirobacillus cienkowskii TaxID=495820 RepID=A0A369KVB2_9BACT|nr:MAG: hypothetical protein DCC88_03385 [Spirobacillus cienkowskii]